MINSVYNFFNRAKYKYEIKSRILRSKILIFFYVSSFIFKGNHVVIVEDNLSEKNIIVEEELDGINRDDIGNLEYLLILVIINEECWNLKLVVDGGEVARNINQMKKLEILQACRCDSVTNNIGECISSISIWNIVNQLGKYVFS